MIKNSTFYYTSDGMKFFSKIAGLEYSRRHNKSLFFYYYDDVYNSCNWNLEPSESLDFYYREQAQRIRDNYDYVILCYSGGYDSTNILETFYYNNIKLDKIVMVGAFKQDSHSMVDENHNGELYHNSFPYLKELGLESITQLYDYTEFFNDSKNFSVYNYGTDWVDTIGAWFSPHNWFWRDIEKHVVPSGLENKKVAIVFGRDKPSLYEFSMVKQGFYFKDVAAISYGNSFGVDNCDRINFYWDPTYPEILIKQLHVLKRYKKEIALSIETKSVNELVYNLKRPLIFKSPKSGNNFLSLRDNFLKEKKDTPIFNLYAAGMKRIEERIGLRSLHPVPSKGYEIL